MIFKMEESAEDWGGEVRENRICFIGRNLNKEFITEAVTTLLDIDNPVNYDHNNTNESNDYH